MMRLNYQETVTLLWTRRETYPRTVSIEIQILNATIGYSDRYNITVICIPNTN